MNTNDFIASNELKRRDIWWDEIQEYLRGFMGLLPLSTPATLYGIPVATMKFCFHCNMERGRAPESECPQCGSILLIERPEYDERKVA